MAESHLLGVTSTVLNGQPFVKRRITYENRLVRPPFPWMIRVARERPRTNETPPYALLLFKGKLTPKPCMEVAVVISVAPCGFPKNCRNSHWGLRLLRPPKGGTFILMHPWCLELGPPIFVLRSAPSSPQSSALSLCVPLVFRIFGTRSSGGRTWTCFLCGT